MFASADARHGRCGDDCQTADPEGASDSDGSEYARQQQTRRKGEQQPQRTAHDVVARQRESHADIAVRPPQGECGQSAPRQRDPCGECPSGEPAQEEGIEKVADILEEERPAGAVERIHLADAPDFDAGRRGDHQCVHQRGCEQRRDRDLRDVPHGAPLRVEHRSADECADDDHRLQADETAFEKLADRHAPPAVVVGVTDDEAREDEEEVDGQIAAVDPLVEMARGVGFEEVEADDGQRGYAAQSVEDVVVGFRVGECGCRNTGFRRLHRVCHRWGFRVSACKYTVNSRVSDIGCERTSGAACGRRPFEPISGGISSVATGGNLRLSRDLADIFLIFRNIRPKFVNAIPRRVL